GWLFFQGEDGIRGLHVTGVQTCALPILGVTSDKRWLRFCQAFELPELASDPRLQSNNDRIRERDWLLPRLRDHVATLTLEDAVDIGRASCRERVQTTGDAGAGDCERERE